MTAASTTWSTAALVALSVVVLLAAPFLARLLARSKALASLLDSFVLVAVIGIVSLHVVPQSAALAGPSALIAAALGLFFPIALHRIDDRLHASSSPASSSRSSSRASSSLRNALVIVALCAGIFVHGTFDGSALSGASVTPSLAVAVLLHRLPAGLALFTVVRPKLGDARFAAVLASYAGGTVAGALLGASVLSSSSTSLFACVQAFVAGSILHIVAESAPYTPSTRRAPPRSLARAPLRAFVAPLADTPALSVRIAGVVGVALAAAALVGVEALENDEHAASTSSSSDAFLHLALACAPSLLLSFVLVGALTALYPDGAPALPSSKRRRAVDALLGVAAGLPHPLCSCAVTPLYEDLVAKGVSPSSSRAFLVAAPELGVPAVLLTARLFGLPFTLARVAGAALLALVSGLVARDRTSPSHTQPHAHDHDDVVGARLMHGVRHGLVDAVDHIGPWFLVGLAVSALLASLLDDDALAHVPPPVTTAVASVAAFPLYLCAAGATPLAAMLVHKGASVGAALAFLLVGPAVSMPTLSLLRRLHGARTAVFFGVGLVVGAFVVGVVVDTVAPGLRTSLASVDVAQPVGVAEAVCLAALAALFLASLVRQGVRGFLVQIMSPQHEHAGDHDHGPGCGHDHGPPVDIPRVALSFDPRRGG